MRHPKKFLRPGPFDRLRAGSFWRSALVVVLAATLATLAVRAWTGPTAPPAGGNPAGSNPPFVTSLPGSPTDGQEIVYQADATNNIYWHLKYKASATKWMKIGGPPLYATVATAESPGSISAWVNLTTAGPSITIPLAGDYLVVFSVDFRAGTASRIIAGVAVGDGTPPQPWADTDSQLAGGAVISRYTLGPFKVAYSVGNVAKIRYNSQNSTNVFFERRHLSIQPIAVQ